MSFSHILPDLHNVWDTYIDFEDFRRDGDCDLNRFIEEWKEKMVRVQSTGCQYSDLLLGLKLIEKVNLHRDSIVSIISTLSSSSFNSESFLSQVVTNIKEQSDSSRLHAQKNEEPNKTRRHENDQNIFEERTIQKELLSYPFKFFDELSLAKYKNEPQEDGYQNKTVNSAKGTSRGSCFLKCPICDKNFMLTETLDLHVNNHNNDIVASEDDYCERLKTIDSPEIDAENYEYENISNGRIKKEVKSETSVMSNNMRVHINASRSTQRSENSDPPKKDPYRIIPLVPCEICDKFIPKNVMKRHMITHTTEAFKCSNCFKEFEKFWMLKRHMECHKTTRDHSCSMCDKTFIRKDALSKHFTKMHTNKKSNPIELADKKKSKTPKRKFPCEVCGKSIAEGSMKTHVKKHFAEAFQCTICPNKYSKLSTLEKHFESHNTSHECNICHKKFNHRKILRTHMETHRTTRDFICAYCGKKFKTKSTLTEHLNLHTKAKPLPCKFCEKIFFSHGLRKFHIRAHHTGEKPYKCDFCDKRFYISSRKIQHMRYHTGEKPFQCHICGRYFRDYTTRKRHIRNVHKEVKPSDI